MQHRVQKSVILTAANCLKDAIPHAPDRELVSLCVQGLEEIAQHQDEYSRLISASEPFAQHLAEGIKMICDDFSQNPAEQHDAAFVLLEDLAIIMREAVLLRGNKPPTPVQYNIMRYFESCGYWMFNDGTLVSDYYYTRVPIHVMKTLIERQEELQEKSD